MTNEPDGEGPGLIRALPFAIAVSVVLYGLFFLLIGVLL